MSIETALPEWEGLFVCRFPRSGDTEFPR
jgi:hypothetical protein